MNLGAVLLGLIPGIAQIHARRPGKGLLLFLLFASTINAWIIAPLLTPDPVVRVCLAPLALLLWLTSLVDSLRLSTEAAIAAEDRPRE